MLVVHETFVQPQSVYTTCEHTTHTISTTESGIEQDHWHMGIMSEHD